MRKKIVLSLIVVAIMIGGFLSLGRVRSEQDIAREMERIAQKEKEDMMNFRLNDINKNNYTVQKTTHLDEYDMDIIEIEHNVTKCKIVLMICDDENRAFNISFKTLPSSDNGVCHITEHSVLAGSRKYNVKDPFFSMAQTSFATFMNAMTGSDLTYYPVSSANEKDFKNLMDVYLDAVFYPNMLKDPSIMQQEGWHYEIEKGSENLKVNGVVYNEMDGTLSTPQTALQYYIMEDLFYGTPYQYNFGGVPENIIDLTFDEFKAFHDMYYSPSNAYIYLYGLLDMNERLEYLQDEYLSDFDYVEVKKPDFDVKKADSKDGIHYYDSDTKDKNKSIISYNFMLKDEKDNLKNIVTGILTNILFYREGSLLKEKLINAGYGEDISYIYDEGMPNASGFVIAENIDAEKKDDYIKMIDDTIQDLIVNGIDKDILMASINTAYLNACEANPGSYTRGIKFSIDSLSSYSNGYGVDNFIKYKEAFTALYKEDLSSKDNIFIQRLREMFVDCENKCVTVLSPKSGYQKDKNKKLQDKLKKRKENFLKEDKDAMKKLVDEYAEYKKARAKEDGIEALASIPKLSIDDIQKEVKLITSDKKEIYGKEVVSTEEMTGELVYIGIDYKLPVQGDDFPDGEKYLLSIATALLGSLDTKNYTYDELSTLVDMYTGGIVFSISLNDVQPILRINTKTKKENLDKTYEIINEILYNTKYNDTNRIRLKLAEYKMISDNAISDYENDASMYRAGSKYSYAYELTDKMKMGRIGFNMFIADFVKIYDKKGKDINKALSSVLSKYIDYDKMFLDCCMTKDNYGFYEESTKKFLKESVELDKNDTYTIPKLSGIMDFDAYKRKFTMEAFVVNTNVNFVARAIKSDEKSYNGHLRVLNNIINYDYLHEKIRVQGGAYGASLIAKENGCLTYFSYSDPKFVETDNVYKNTNIFIKNLDMSKDDIDANIIGSIRKIDTYPLPYEKHLRNLSYCIKNIDNTYLNNLRNEILNTTLDDLKEYADIFAKATTNSEFCAIVTVENQELAKEKYKIVNKIGK